MVRALPWLAILSSMVALGLGAFPVANRDHVGPDRSNARPDARGPEGRERANAWGLYDMLGNVYEWCEDWAGAYPGGTVTDPQGASSGSARVARGGSWLVHDNRTRSCFRDFFAPDLRRDDVGFRVVAVAPARSGPRTEVDW